MGASSQVHGDDILRFYIQTCSNWGRWGAHDELGTLNYVTNDQVLDGSRCIREGETISLTLPYGAEGPQPGTIRPNPLLVTTATGTDHISGAQDELGPFGPANGFGYADDLTILPNQAGTQWDALSHIFFEGQMWNGVSAAEVTSAGAARNGVENYAAKIVTRGVLLDVAAFKQVEELAPGYAITVDDLEACAAQQAVELRPGDALLVRTGQLGARRGAWGDFAGGSAPGLSLHTAPWLHERQIAAVATDTWGVEVRPNEIGYFQPFHIVALVHMGLAIGEIFDLDGLAHACARDGHFDFLLSASPLPITGAAGAPVAAVAIR